MTIIMFMNLAKSQDTRFIYQTEKQTNKLFYMVRTISWIINFFKFINDNVNIKFLELNLTKDVQEHYT